MDFSLRTDLPEAMDDPALPPAIYARCLDDLAAVNRLTLTHRPTLRWLRRATKDWPQGAAFSVLDIAYGDGDLLRAIARFAARRGFVARLMGLDLNPRSAAVATAASPGLGIEYRTGDVFGADVDLRADFIVTSQFTHHLSRHQIVRLLRLMDANAAKGWHITDLHRHTLAYHGFPVLARVMGWHKIVRRDGQISVARGFTKAEWHAMTLEAGTPARIGWVVPFRHSICALK